MDLRHFVSLSTTSSLVGCRNKTQIKFVILSPVDRFMWGPIRILHISMCYVTLLVIIDASCFSQLWWQTWSRAVLKYLCNTVFVYTTFCVIHLLAVLKLVQPSLLAKRLRRTVCAFLRCSILMPVPCDFVANGNHKDVGHWICKLKLCIYTFSGNRREEFASTGQNYLCLGNSFAKNQCDW